jgi:hypothetical protein
MYLGMQEWMDGNGWQWIALDDRPRCCYLILDNSVVAGVPSSRRICNPPLDANGTGLPS